MLSVSKVWLAVSMDERMNPVYRYVKPQYTNERKINKSSADTGVVLEIPDYGCECDLYKKYVGSLFDYDLVLVRPAIYVKHPSPTNVTSAGTIVVQSSVYNKYITTEPYRRFTGNVHTFDEIIYQWNKAPVDDYVCVGYDKHYKEYYQYSYDGENWYDVAPISSRTSSDVIEYNSMDCGYIPPFKYLATYSDSHIESAYCGSSDAMSKSNLVSVIYGDCVTSIGSYAFNNCNTLTSITIPNSVTSIGGSAFYGCRGLTSIIIPDSVTSIGGTAFSGCTSLTSINIPSGITTIKSYVFSSCISLTSITIPSGVTSIGESAFANCSGLTSITIPSSVGSIGNEAFSRCSGLTSIIDERTFPQNLGIGVFYGSECVIYVPAESVDSYKNRWSDYSDRIQAIP